MGRNDINGDTWRYNEIYEVNQGDIMGFHLDYISRYIPLYPIDIVNGIIPIAYSTSQWDLLG